MNWNNILQEIKARLNSQNVLYIEKDVPHMHGTQIKTQDGLIINIWTNANVTFQGKRNQELEDLVLGKSKPKSKFSSLENLDNLKGLSELFYQISEEHGFTENFNFSEQMMNLHAEISEYWEAYRNDTLEEPCDKWPDLSLSCEEEEWADIFIRTLVLAKARNINIAEAIKAKTLYNDQRPYQHGGKRC